MTIHLAVFVLFVKTICGIRLTQSVWGSTQTQCSSLCKIFLDTMLAQQDASGNPQCLSIRQQAKQIQMQQL